MEYVYKMLLLLVGIIAFILFGSSALGFNCGRNNSHIKIAEVPCSPILPNGDKNPHYYNEWSDCRSKCNYPKLSILNMRTCECSCR